MRLFLLLALSVSLAIETVAAETVKTRLSSGLFGLAQYLPGDEGKPAVLILHGFLSSYNFNTVLGIGEMLAENGFTVLAPNLTLGIQARKSSLACEAIHTNSLDDDVAEISQWVDWLKQRQQGKIYLLGHSYGSLELLAYTHSNATDSIAGLITTSLSFVDGFNDDGLLVKQIALSERKLTRGDRKSLFKYTLSYCKNNFPAPAGVYLSYTRWSEQQVLRALKSSRIPVHVIMGGADDRFDKAWFQTLEQTGVNLQIIPGASHFFSNMQEFELHEAILDIVGN